MLTWMTVSERHAMLNLFILMGVPTKYTKHKRCIRELNEAVDVISFTNCFFAVTFNTCYITIWIKYYLLNT